ncbi:hypothetical protein RhiirA4_526115 [Rhizophagus irregularis]|uniref:MIR domain-containing protein n=1 Tax=Rhizophagus irregularis TaxID=588596 RepID=A0A2I1GQC3_9GLOM|nr:hypothetical protein RhiirA4_526115 [Rhizophagus irregularis]
MDIPKYNGNIHPDEWINDIQRYLELRHKDEYGGYYLNTAIALVDSNIISLPAEINSFEELSNALKEDISFTLFKCANKRLLQSLKYIPEREGGNTSKFISNFRKLCYNSEINDIEEQKNYFYRLLPNNEYYNYFLTEFFKRKEKIKSMSDLVKEFTEIVTDETNLVRNESIVALKHFATGKYLSSIGNLHYKTGSRYQLVFAGSPEPDPNALWKIKFDKELAIYNKTSISLQHINSGNVLGLYCYCKRKYDIYTYKSPITELTEVCCGGNEISWKFNHSKLENHQGYLMSNDTINLSITIEYDNSQNLFLRSHDVQFTIGNDTFQEVVCHSERLGGNDEDYDDDYLNFAISLVDSSIISLPTKINSFEELRNALKEDISFTVFKCTNKRLLESLKYIPEKEGGNTSKFISDFRKLCYDSEINDIEEQKNYFSNALYYNDRYSYLSEFINRRKKINSMNDLIKEFTEIIADELNLIRNESIIALKHVATGKYLSSIEDLCYTTGSGLQLVFAGSSEPDLNSLWIIKFRGETAIYNGTLIELRHIESGRNLGLCYFAPKVHTYYKSPITEHTEVYCGKDDYCEWRFKHSKSENHEGYLKSYDTINLAMKKTYDSEEVFLRSHDVRFTIGNDTFQEVVCHNESLGGNDEWRIELICKNKLGYEL